MKYLRYAIGEIALVVIGILIALQINTWNEERKVQEKEHALLMDVRSNILDIKKELEKGKEFNQMTLDHYNLMFQHLEAKKAYTTDLDRSFGLMDNWHSPFLTQTAYETLKTTGMDIIKSKELRQKITELYELNFIYLSGDYDKVEWTLSESVKTPLITRHLRFYRDKKSDMTYAKPSDYSLLIEDTEFLNMLSNLIVTREQGIRGYDYVLTTIDETVAVIDSELEQK